MARNVDDVLKSAKRVLEHALSGEADFLEGADRRLSGLYNAVSSGRSVTFVIQNLRSTVQDFDEWYLPIQDEMRADPVSKYFHDLRNQIEKEGDHGSSSTSVHLDYLDPIDLARNAPTGAKSFFVGDQLGRSGWIVALPDGTETTVYFKLSASVGKVMFALKQAPDGRELHDLLRQWLASVESVYLAAVERFAPRSPELRRDHGRESGFDDVTVSLLNNAIRQSGYGPR